jgi:hypothetical protein
MILDCTGTDLDLTPGALWEVPTPYLETVKTRKSATVSS